MALNVRLTYQTGRSGVPPLTRDEEKKYPFVLAVNLSPPEFMQVAFVMMHGGSEEIEVRGDSVETLSKFCDDNQFATHPRLRRMTICRDGRVVRSFSHGGVWVDGDGPRQERDSKITEKNATGGST